MKSFFRRFVLFQAIFIQAFYICSSGYIASMCQTSIHYKATIIYFMPLIYYYLPRVFDMKYVRFKYHNAHYTCIAFSNCRRIQRGYLYWFYATDCMYVQHTVEVRAAKMRPFAHTHVLMSNVDVFSTSFHILFLSSFFFSRMYVS